MGGAERYILALLPELKKRKIEVGFFCTQQRSNKEIIAYFIRHFEQFNIPVYVCKSAALLSIKAAYFLARTINKGQYNILSAHLIHAEIISVLSKVLFNRSCKLVVTKHGYLQKFMDQYGLDHTKINRLSLSYQAERFLQRFINKNFAVSKGLADFYILSHICKPSKMAVIYHGAEAGIDIQDYSPVRYSKNQLLIAGRLRKFKGHRFLVEAAKILCREVPDLKVVIVGDGIEMNNLMKIVNDHKLDTWFVFAGYTDQVRNYMYGSDVIVAPSLAEPFGLVVLEAYSCHKPVIAFNVTAFNESIIHNETGYLVPPYDIGELARQIRSLLQDKATAKKLGENGYQLLLGKFSLKRSVEKTIAFFERIE